MKPPHPPPEISEINTTSHQFHGEPSTPLWDWSEYLDLNIHDQLGISWNSDHPTPSDPPPIPVPSPSPETSYRVRKRDPMLICPNYLAGIIPCACPELDEKLEEEERVLPGKKRARTAAAGKLRCQVPECEADIRELKGYHRRHRVCLGCANASAVVLGGQSKRYCQQCGKFHILSDFDEGKRSCRRKLERHNNRRRRKSRESGGAVDIECQGGLLAKDIACDDEAEKDIVYLSSRDTEKEAVLEPEDQHISTLRSSRDSQNIQNDNFVSYVGSGETQMGGGRDDFKTLSPSYCDNKSAYSSMCHTDRISFKLYDWNPAEFPRRLRHQIFQWLASMPVELEGYIRPGCTILTVFIAMPKVMWVKLSEDPAMYIRDFVVTPGKMLSGRGTLFVSLNDLIFCVRKDEISMIKELRPPKLHYVHPFYFEAGKPIEFVACGSNLLQPKFRFLVSFGGKYLTYDYCVPLPYGNTAGTPACGFDHQLYRILINHTEPELFGPAFIEVENQSGVSNFIPILIGDNEICSEMKTVLQKLDTALYSKGSQFAAISSLSDSCEVSVLRQRTFSEFLLDIGWLLREPLQEDMQHVSSSHIERFNCLLNYLIQNESPIILERMLNYMKIWEDNMKSNSPANGTSDAHTRLFQRNMDRAREILHLRFQKEGDSVVRSGNLLLKRDGYNQRFENGMHPALPTVNQETEVAGDKKHGTTDTGSLLNNEVVMNMNLIKEHPRKPCTRIFGNMVLTSRPLVFIISAAAVCLGICAVLLHRQKVGQITVTIRRSLFDDD